MSVEILDLGGGAREERVARAAAALARGGLVVLPTETVYGVAASAASAEALDLLWRAKGAGARRSALAWHAPSTDAVIAALWGSADRAPPVHRRLVERLTPGAVTFAVEMAASAIERTRGGAAPGAFDDGREVLVRVPDRAAAREVLARAGVPVVVASLRSSHHAARTAEDAAAALADSGSAELVELILDDGPARIGKQSTLVRLEADGGYSVARVGAVEERYIRKQLTKTVLFVCTGNTCRSPMAEAMARHMLAQRPALAEGEGVEMKVRSAGVSAGYGMRATPEGVEAVNALGVPMGAHASMPLTREMINAADVIYGMTAAHVEVIRRLDGSASGRVMLLDPEGRDIPDPIGGPPELYERTAKMLMEAVGRRAGEW